MYFMLKEYGYQFILYYTFLCLLNSSYGRILLLENSTMTDFIVEEEKRLGINYYGFTVHVH